MRGAWADPAHGGARQLVLPTVHGWGPRFQQWQTTFTFLNTNDVPAHLDLFLYNHDGSGALLDLGNGAASHHTLTIPAFGSRILRSRIASETNISGWAAAYTDVPVVGGVTFRMIVNGTPFLELSALPTLPTLNYISAAKRTLGVAIANVFIDSAITVRAELLDSEGRTLGSQLITVPPSGHREFVVHQLFPSIPDFTGTLRLSAENPPGDSFLAWTVYENDGIMSSLPPGPSAWPIPHWDQIWLVYQRVGAAAVSAQMLDSLPELKILYDRVVNAYARGGLEVGVTLGLSQLISDSPSELAFALAHELGHIYQQRNGGKLVFNTNAEFDADIWGALLSLGAGYDPYAAAGTLAKLSMATGTAGLAAQNFEDQLTSDAHRSFNTRLATIFETLQAACSDADTKPLCDQYKAIIHPNLPNIAPLRTPAGVRR